MATETYDVIVLGVGGMGSATLYHLAKRGHRVCGVEQFGVAHDRGSSHGQTRIIRKAYFEAPDYLPLLDRAYDLWRDLQQESGRELQVSCEMLVTGAPDSEVVHGLEAAYGKYDVPHERLSANEARNAFPQFNLPEDFVVYRDPFAGFLRVEDCVRTFASLAEQHGAGVIQNEKVLGWSATSNHVTVKTDRRTLTAANLVITAGAWTEQILKELELQLEIWRKLAFWFDGPNISQYSFGKFPIFYVELEYGDFYGFPALNELGLKVAEHRHADIVPDPDELERQMLSGDERLVLRFLSDILPTFEPVRTNFSACMYTKTPDESFILDIHPQHENVVLGCGFSGHGFKFAPVVGEVLADLSLTGQTALPIDFLRLSRLR